MRSKDLFMLMREEEIQTSNFLPTKKEINLSSTKFIKDILEAGMVDKYELIAQAKRMQEALDAITTELLKVLPQEDFEAYGLKGTFRSGGDTINYAECEVWQDLNQGLTEREAFLKVACKNKSEIYDQYGFLVPRVSTTPRKSRLAISF